jgi:thiamine pyrophosphate-dependent acetolactate synthase large subunit-like protein
MGAKMARPDVPVVSVVGDGGLMMYLGELATWARLNLPLVLVVMVDNDLTQVKRRQEKNGLPTGSTTFQRIDFCAIARALGINAIRTDNPLDYRAAVEKAVGANEPTLIEAVLDAKEYRRIPGWK